MKKIGLITIAALALLSLSACGNNDSKSASGTDTSELASLRSENKSLKKEVKSLKSSSSDKTKDIANSKVDLTTQKNGIEGRISKVSQKFMVKNENDYTNAEYNIQGSVPNKYYKATLSFAIKNLGDKAIDLSYGEITLTDATNQTFSLSSNEHYLYTNSTDVIDSKATIDDKLELISESKIDLSKFKINFTQGLSDHDGNEIQAPFSLEYTNK